MPISEKLIEQLIISSNFILYSIALFVFYKAISPIYNSFEAFYNNLAHGNKKKLDTNLKLYLQNFSLSVLQSNQNITSKVINFIDKLYRFKIEDSNKIRGCFQIQPLFTSWILSYIYLTFFLLIIGYSTFSEYILWQFVFLIVYYSIIYYKLTHELNHTSFIIFTIIISIIFISSINLKGWDAFGPIIFSILGGSIGGIMGIIKKQFNFNSFYMALISNIILLSILGMFKISIIDIFDIFGNSIVFLTTFTGAFIGFYNIGIIFSIISGIGIGIGLGITLIIESNDLNFNKNNIFYFFEGIDKTFNNYEILSIIILFFILFPFLNATLDWISITVTRYEFSKLLNSSKSYITYIRIIIWDLMLAFGFKLLVLLLLYINSHIWVGNPAVFKIDTIREYWCHLLDLYLFSDVDMSYFYSTKSTKLISLMIMTTLLPSIGHIVILIFHIIYKILSQILGLVSHLFTGNARFFSFVMSLVSVGTLWIIVSYSFNPPTTKAVDTNLRK